MDELIEEPRILPGDALTLLLNDLVSVAPTVAISAEAFGRWFASCVDLLACVPHRDQRLSWAYCLVQPLSGGADWLTVVLGDLMRFAEEVRQCRVSS
jgi:hypothetical protein